MVGKIVLIDFDVIRTSCLGDYFSIVSQYKKYFDKNAVRKVKLSLSAIEQIPHVDTSTGYDISSL